MAVLLTWSALRGAGRFLPRLTPFFSLSPRGPWRLLSPPRGVGGEVPVPILDWQFWILDYFRRRAQSKIQNPKSKIRSGACSSHDPIPGSCYPGGQAMQDPLSLQPEPHGRAVIVRLIGELDAC